MVIGIYLILIFGIILSVSIFSTSRCQPISEYELYGEKGAEEWEREQMGITIDEYEQYKKDGYVK